MLKNLQLNDSGNYSCLLSRNSLLNTVQLFVHDPDSRVFDHLETYFLKDSISTQLNKTVYQVCTAMTDGKDLDITWYDPNNRVNSILFLMSISKKSL